MSDQTAKEYRYRATAKRRHRQPVAGPQQRPRLSTSSALPSSAASINQQLQKYAHRPYRLTVAIPAASILAQAQSAELQTYLAGQLARCCAVYRVDEVVIYREQPRNRSTKTEKIDEKIMNDEKQEDGESFKDVEFKVSGDDGLFVSFTDAQETIAHVNRQEMQDDENVNQLDLDVLARRIFEYMECPPYLRRALFPHHRDLRYAGLLNPLELPHHLRRNEWFPYREGVVVSQPSTNSQKRPQKSTPVGEQDEQASSTAYSNLVDCGWPEPVKIPQKLPVNTRVTLAMSRSGSTDDKNQRSHIRGECVSPDLPRQEGWYWGYNVRLADSFRAIFTECPYEDGYQVTVGTSDAGHSIWDHVPSVDNWIESNGQSGSFKPTSKRPINVLVVFGGAHGIEVAVENDNSIEDASISAADCFDFWVNTCPFQGSRLIRTEEAMLISLSWLTRWLENSKELALHEEDEQQPEDAPEK